MSAAELLVVEDLSVTFPTEAGPVNVVDGLSFSVESGKTLGIVGESGSGKSMTSLAIMGLLPRSATASGRVGLQGRSLLGASDRELRRVRGEQVAMVFQDPLSSLNPYYTVGVQIEEAYRAHRPVSRREARRIAVSALSRVGIADASRRVDDYPHQFSGGMRQRVMIAMALCLSPSLLIADEPTTALDVTVQAQILSLLADLQRDTDMGMIFITHDLAVVSEVADDVVVMRDGRQVEAGSCASVFARPRDLYTRELLAAIPRVDASLATAEEERS